MRSFFNILVVMLVTLWNLTDAGSFNNNPGTVYVHENQDSVVSLWSISATCSVSWTCGYTCYYDCSYTSCGRRRCRYIRRTCSTTCYTTCYGDVTCSNCALTSNPSSLFQMSGKTVQKIACSSPGCGTTCSSSGCTNAGETYNVGVRCWSTGYNTDGAISTSFTLSITANSPPTFNFQSGSSINVSKSSAGSGTVVNRMIASDTDLSVDGDTIRYRLASGPRASWIHGNTLFALNTGNGEIYVTQSLAFEFSYTFSMTLCVYDRRDETCNSLAITLHACFQTPNCTDQSDLTVEDTHGLYTGHGTTNTLFNMIYPVPDEHFPAFSSVWHDLTWTFTLNELSSATINSDTGEIYLTTNISIHPAWPSKDFSMTVQVANSESCYVTTCDMFIRVWYTNWPLEIRSLPATTYLHEDTDAETLIHTLVLYDYNYEYEDNFTCAMTAITPHEDNLFDFRHVDGLYNWDSYKIYKKACQTPDCGYKGSSYLCATNIGCMNHNLTNEYVLTIHCSDAYGSSETDYLTFRVIKNRRPEWINLPNTIVLNTDAVSHLDTVYSITYWDLENERLYYEYTYTPDLGYFLGTDEGNYYNDLANITMTIFLWDRTNTTISVYINAHERRNEIDEYLTILLRENCGETPVCSSTSHPVTTEFSVGGTIETIANQVQAPSNGVAFSGLTYSIASSNPGYFTVDPSTGEITTLQALTASYPTTSYSITAFVFDTNACGYGACTVTVVVTPVNYPISVTNLPATVSIHEDTVALTTLYVILTSDNNADDTVDCSITSISPAQTDGSPDIFFLSETVPGSDVFMILSRDNPGFSSALTQYLVTVSCADSQGSTDGGTLTVDITLNDAPTFTNLGSPTTLTVDQATVLSGQVIYTVQGSDTEGDTLIFYCSVANTFVPLECESGTNELFIKLRRSVDIVTEHNAVYAIDVTLGDAKHINSSSGQLSVTFTSSRTYPAISNLPTTVSFAENIAIGTPLFDVDVTDPDVGDVHTFTLTSVEPSLALSQFMLNPNTGEVTSLQTFDYETQTYYTLTFRVSDQNLVGPVKQDLNITITNINEAPSLAVAFSSISFPEDTVVGTALDDPGFTCTDPDVPDTQTYSITSGTHAAYFSINSTSGVISLAQTWDLENGLPSSTFLEVTCSDSGGLTATALITIEIAYANEFPPSLSVDYPGGTSAIQISAATSVIDSLLTVTVSDNDAGPGSSFTFQIAGQGHGTEYFVMTTTGIATQYHLRVRSIINLYTDRNFTFTIIVSDGGLQTSIAVDVLYSANDTSTLIGPESKCVTCTSNGRLFVGVMAVEGVIILVCILHWVVHCVRIRKRNRKPLPPVVNDIPKNMKWRGPVFQKLSLATPITSVSKTLSSHASKMPRHRTSVVKPERPGTTSVQDISSAESSVDSDSDSDSDGSVIQTPARKTFNPSMAPNQGRRPSNYEKNNGLPVPVYTSGASTAHALSPRPSTLSNNSTPAFRRQSQSHPFDAMHRYA